MKRKKVVALLLAAAMTSASFLPSVGTFNTEGPLANGVVAMADVNASTVASQSGIKLGLEESFDGDSDKGVDAYFFESMTNGDYNFISKDDYSDEELNTVSVGQIITRGAVVTGSTITSAEALATSLGATVSLSAIDSDKAVTTYTGNVVSTMASVTTGVAVSGGSLKNFGIVNSAAAISGSVIAAFPGKATVRFVSGAAGTSFGAFTVKVMADAASTVVTNASLTKSGRTLTAAVTSRSYIDAEGNKYVLDDPEEYVSGSSVTYEWYYNADTTSTASLTTIASWTPLSGSGDEITMTSAGAYAVIVKESKNSGDTGFVTKTNFTTTEADDADATLVAVTGQSIVVNSNKLSVVKPGYVRADGEYNYTSADGLKYTWYVISESAYKKGLTTADKTLLDSTLYTENKVYGRYDNTLLISGMKNLYFAVKIEDGADYIDDSVETNVLEDWLVGGPFSYVKSNDTGKKSGSSSSTSGGTSGSTSGSTGSNSTTGNNNTTNTSTTTTDTTKPADNAPTSTTVENADGSKTTTTKETKADGTVVESVKTVYKDNSSLETITETRKDGTTIETTIETAANGDKATTTYTTNPNTKTRSKEVSIVRVDGTSETTTITESTEDGSATIVNATKDAAGETSIEYTLPANGSGLTVGKIETTAKKVVIPAKIAIAGGNATLKGVTSLRANTLSIEGKTIKVTKVGAAALKGNKTATKLTIGKNIKTIGKQAFMNASKVKTVNFKGNVNTIGKNSFKNINKKATIKIKATAKQFKALKKKIKNKGAAPAKVTYKRVK